MRQTHIIPEQRSKRVKIKSVKEDYLVCVSDNAIVGQPEFEVKVAKPYNLRAKVYDGQTISYTNWSNGTTINVAYTAHASSNYNSRTADYQMASLTCDKGPHIELLYPPYLKDDYIMASASTTANEGDYVAGIGPEVHWLDENREGRYWQDDCGAGGGGGSVWV
jgi:hypothetical protein